MARRGARQRRLEDRLEELISTLTPVRSSPQFAAQVSPQMPGPNSPQAEDGTDEATARPVVAPHLNAAILNILPTFEGKTEENVQFFIKQFRNVAAMVKLDSAQMAVIIGSKLKGRAQEWLQANQQMHNEKCFEKIATAMLNYFDDKQSPSQKQAEFHKIRQKPGVGVKQLAQTLKNAACRYLQSAENQSPEAENLTNMILVGKFVDSLKRKIRIELNKIGYSNFEEAVAVAERIERALIDDGIGEDEEVNNIQMADHSDQKLAQDLQIQLLTAEVNNLRMRNKKCVICDHDDHFADRCPSNKQRARDRSPPPKCVACGKVGHWMLNCFFVQDFTQRMQRQTENNNYRGRGSFRSGHRGNGRGAGNFGNRHPFQNNDQNNGGIQENVTTTRGNGATRGQQTRQ